MFKNSVLKVSVDTKEWFKKAGIRAVKTFAQSMASFITVGAALKEIDWGYIVSVSVVSAIYSIATSVAGIPEVKSKEE
jgi:hypothetical protein